MITVKNKPEKVYSTSMLIYRFYTWFIRIINSIINIKFNECTKSTLVLVIVVTNVKNRQTNGQRGQFGCLIKIVETENGYLVLKNSTFSIENYTWKIFGKNVCQILILSTRPNLPAVCCSYITLNQMVV